MKIDFEKYSDGLVPAIVQHADTLQVLMLGFMDKAALDKTNETKLVTFFSRSKNRLWTKGEESGNHLALVDIKVDCDNDTILAIARPKGPTCHLGNFSCFGVKNPKGFIFELEKIIESKIESNDENSYTKSLIDKGINKVAQKVGEEAVELVIEAKDHNKELFLNEAADLMYHFTLLLKAKGNSLEEVEKVLLERHSKSTK